MNYKPPIKHFLQISIPGIPQLNENTRTLVVCWGIWLDIGAFVYSVAFDSGKMLASGSYDTTMRLWDKVTGSLLRTITGHGNWVGYFALSYSCKMFASGPDYEAHNFWADYF